MCAVGIAGNITRVGLISSIVLQGLRSQLSSNCTDTKEAREKSRKHQQHVSPLVFIHGLKARSEF